MAIPTIEWDEGNPSGTQAKSLGAKRIRELKTQFQEIFGVDHIISSFGSGDSWGYHSKCTLHVPESDPLPAENTGMLVAGNDSDTDKAELAWIDENDNVIQITSGGSCNVGIPQEIRMWAGTLENIPYGWYLCDGNNSTPNLIAKFIRGIHTNITEPGEHPDGTGSDTVTLDIDNVPSHTHTTTSDGTHTHVINAYLSSGTSAITPYGQTLDNVNEAGLFSTESAHTHTTASSGSGTAYNNLPAYLELGFIMKGS